MYETKEDRKENQIVYYDGENVIIGVRYCILNDNDTLTGFDFSSPSDMRIKFGPCGVNNLYQLKGIMIKANTDTIPDKDFNEEVGSVLFESNTDFIGPYIVHAVGNGIDGRRTKFTGGWHGSSGGSTGNPTARCISVQFFIDGESYMPCPMDSIYCNTVDIVVKNRVQGYNTTFFDSCGDDREVLEECIKYTIVNGMVEVNAEIKAIEDVIIERYYGLQTINTAYNGTVHYRHGHNTGIKRAFQKNTSGEKSIYPDVDQIYLVSEDGDHGCIAWIDRGCGLGILDNVDLSKPVAFTEDYGKSYFNLINGIPKVLNLGETAKWHGGYVFHSIKHTGML